LKEIWGFIFKAMLLGLKEVECPFQWHGFMLKFWYSETSAPLFNTISG
jgi:hypothetical protein